MVGRLAITTTGLPTVVPGAPALPKLMAFGGLNASLNVNTLRPAGAVIAPRPSNVTDPLVGETVVSAPALTTAVRLPEFGTVAAVTKVPGALAENTICFSDVSTLAVPALGSWVYMVSRPPCAACGLFKQFVGLLRRIAS